MYNNHPKDAENKSMGMVARVKNVPCVDKRKIHSK
jgi:hypothetical protein